MRRLVGNASARRNADWLSSYQTIRANPESDYGNGFDPGNLNRGQQHPRVRRRNVLCAQARIAARVAHERCQESIETSTFLIEEKMRLALLPSAIHNESEIQSPESPLHVDFTDTGADTLSQLDALPYDLLFSEGLLPGGNGLKIAAKANGKNVNLILSFKALAIENNATP
jgi:hypothetical protein